MPTAPVRSHLRPAALALALSLVLTLFVGSTAADAATVERINGENRYDTGAKVSAFAFPDADDVDTVYVATGANFPDALAAGAAAAAVPGPVILTDPNELSDEARDELRRLAPSTIVLVGGEVALSEDVEDAIKGDDELDAEVRRIAGDNRFDTAAKVTLDAFPDGVDRVFVATGRGFPDALAGVPAAARFGTGLLLVEKDSVPQETADAIVALGAREVIILGGFGVVEFSVQDELEELDGVEDAGRLAGENRFETAADVSARAYAGGARTVYLATGRAFPDALTGGPAAAVQNGPLLLTEKDELPPETAAELRALNPRRVVILGGENAVSNAVRDAVNTALEGSTALPSGATPDFAYATVDNREGPRRGLQTINLGTLDGAFETISNPTPDEDDVRPVFNQDGTRVLFLRSALEDEFDQDPRIHVAEVADGTSIEVLDPETLEGGCGLSSTFWAPGGSRIVVLCTDRVDDNDTPDNEDDDTELPPRAYLVNLRGTATELPSDEAWASIVGGVAAPTGSTIALSVFDGDQTSSIVQLDLDQPDQDPTLITNTNGTLFSLQWSGDGSTIVGNNRDGFGFNPPAGIVVVDVESGNTTAPLAEDDVVPQIVRDLSDDGATALVQRFTYDDETDTNDSLVLVDLASGDVTTLLAPGDVTYDWISNAAFISNGTRVIFDDLQASGFAFGGRPGSADVGVIRSIAVDGTDIQSVIEVEDVIAAGPSPTEASSR